MKNTKIYNNITLVHTEFDTINSTQLYARHNIKSLKPNEWQLYTAKEQTSGIGTKNTIWVSPYDVNVYATYAFLLEEKHTAKIIHITQVSALTVSELLSSEGINSTVKWVNDILINKKKVCGVLAESSTNAFEENGVKYLAVLVGIGINVNSEQQHLVKISQPATSIKMETSKELDIKNIVDSLSQLLITNINKLTAGDFSLFLPQLNERLEKFGDKAIVVKEVINNSIIYKVGYIKGVKNQGELILQTKEGELSLMNGCIARGDDLKEALMDKDVFMQIHEFNNSINGDCIVSEDYSY